jgi:hypothetical protein
MHATYEHKSGWFPVIGVRFEKLSELLFAAFIAVITITALVYILVYGKKTLTGVAKSLALPLTGIILHTLVFAYETAATTYHTLQQIPTAWYPTTALTIIPITVDIPRQWAAWFLVAYCASNGWLVTHGIKTHGTVSKEYEQRNSKKHLEIASSDTRSHLFTGMRISIHQ